MLLEQIMNDPMKSFVYMERYVNDGSPSGYTWTNLTSSRTSPLGENSFFLLDILCIDDVKVIGDRLDWLDSIGKNALLIHPDMREKYKNNGFNVRESFIKVSPLSSSRTVKLLDYPGFIKLNYNGIIGRIDRSLTDKHAYLSVEMSRYLENILKKTIYSKLAYFPETCAMFYKDEITNIGMVYRDERILGINAEKVRFLIPMFALFSRDKYSLDDCLLVQLINKSCKNPLEYILNDLIFVLIDNYFNLILHEGIQPEWHAQNLVLGIDEKYSIVTLIMRDLESIDIDETIQESIGLKWDSNSHPYKRINKRQYNYQIKHSFMYDFKIGEYVFEPIINCACKYFNLEKNIIENKIKEYSKQYIEMLPKKFFPPDVWYSFDKVLIDRTASYRPYIKNYNIKYRG